MIAAQLKTARALSLIVRNLAPRVRSVSAWKEKKKMFHVFQDAAAEILLADFVKEDTEKADLLHVIQYLDYTIEYESVVDALVDDMRRHEEVWRAVEKKMLECPATDFLSIARMTAMDVLTFVADDPFEKLRCLSTQYFGDKGLLMKIRCLAYEKYCSKYEKIKPPSDLRSYFIIEDFYTDSNDDF